MQWHMYNSQEFIIVFQVCHNMHTWYIHKLKTKLIDIIILYIQQFKLLQTARTVDGTVP